MQPRDIHREHAACTRRKSLRPNEIVAWHSGAMGFRNENLII